MVRRSQSSLPGGPGLVEEGLHQASGLRSFIQRGVFATSDKCVATSLAALTNTSTWTTLVRTLLTTGSSRLPFPCTPCVTYRQTNGAPANNQTFSVRVSGFDQFGVHQVEEVMNLATLPATDPAPGVPIVPYVRRTRLWLSKVFAAITSVEYQVASVQAASDFLDVGVHWDWDFSQGSHHPYETYIGQENQGVGTPYRIAPYGPAVPFTDPDMLSLEVSLPDPQTFPILGSIVASGATEGLATINGGLAGGLDAISVVSVANPSVLTCGTGAHGYPNRMRVPVIITNANGGTPSINGLWMATIVSATTFSIPVNVTVAPTIAALSPLVIFPRAAGPRDRPVPIQIVGAAGGTVGAGAVAMNGWHMGRIVDHRTLAVPTEVTGAFTTGGHAQILNMPSAVLGPLSVGVRAGFRVGKNAAGFIGTPNKWALYKADAGSFAVAPTPIVDENNLNEGAVVPITTGLMVPPGARLAWAAYFRTSLGTFRSTSAERSYPT